MSDPEQKDLYPGKKDLEIFKKLKPLDEAEDIVKDLNNQYKSSKRLSLAEKITNKFFNALDINNLKCLYNIASSFST